MYFSDVITLICLSHVRYDPICFGLFADQILNLESLNLESSVIEQVHYSKGEECSLTLQLRAHVKHLT